MERITVHPMTTKADKDKLYTWPVAHALKQEMRSSFFPSEWYPQSGIQLTWPHEKSDWKDLLEEVETCFITIAKEISKRTLLLIVTPDVEKTKAQLAELDLTNIRFCSCATNDTWARDHAFITIIEENKPVLIDFTFNGWGNKFEATLDNQINQTTFEAGCFKGSYRNQKQIVLEGGSIESDGLGTLLTTSKCLLSNQRNPQLNKTDLESYLLNTFHAQQLLWLNYGYLAGDDTDSHIDTLARLCPHNTILYVCCEEDADEHFSELKKMEMELKAFRTLNKQPFTFKALPMPDAIYVDNERLPATYANFLILNEAILYPTYQQPIKDQQAKEVIQSAFPTYEVVGIDCTTLIKQHGSLHCVTMQYPQHTLI